VPDLWRWQGCVGSRAGNVMGKTVARQLSGRCRRCSPDTCWGISGAGVEVVWNHGSLWDDDIQVAFVASSVAKLDEGGEEIWGRVSGVSSFCSCIPDQQQSAMATISCDSNQQISPATASGDGYSVRSSASTLLPHSKHSITGTGIANLQ